MLRLFLDCCGCRLVVYYWILRFVASLVVELVSLGLVSYCGWWLLVVNAVVCLVLWLLLVTVRCLGFAALLIGCSCGYVGLYILWFACW